jgi:pyoverdine/dityrosine biosynthesis protein Dit1
MKSTVNMRLGHEILQASALHDFPWPATDPSKTVQELRNWDADCSALLDAAVANTGFSFQGFQESGRDLSTADQLWNLLTHKAYNFNGVTAVRGEFFWRQRIESAVRRNEPVVIVYPLICKIANPAKRMTTVGITAGERAVVRFFRSLGEQAEAIHAPGIRIRILSDATLYNSALQVPPPSAYAYINEVRALAEEENPSGTVEVYDYSELLSPFYREFEAIYDRAYHDLGAQRELMLDENSQTSLPTSVRASINSRRLGLDYPELLEVFGPRQVRFREIRREIDDMAVFGLREQLAIKLACDELNVPEKIWPEHIRASCHKGKKNGRAVLGLRCYPEYYRSSKLLPYHGMPLIQPDYRGRPRLTILPEIILRSRAELVRVVNELDEPVLYLST